MTIGTLATAHATAKKLEHTEKTRGGSLGYINLRRYTG
jgi:hypothetical protein